MIVKGAILFLTLSFAISGNLNAQGEDGVIECGGGHPTLIKANRYYHERNYDMYISTMFDYIESSVDDYEIARAYLFISRVQIWHRKDLAESASALRKAIAIRPNWGYPYIELGKLHLYSAKTCATDELSRYALISLGISKLEYAMSIDTLHEIQIEATKYIKTYNAHLPTKDIASKMGYIEGMRLTNPCWPEETIELRLQK